MGTFIQVSRQSGRCDYSSCLELFKQELLQDSGLSLTDFCRNHNVSYWGMRYFFKSNSIRIKDIRTEIFNLENEAGSAAVAYPVPMDKDPQLRNVSMTVTNNGISIQFQSVSISQICSLLNNIE